MAVFICQSCGNEHSSWEGKCPKCGQTESIKLNQAADKMIDRVIKGKYKLIRKLGQGGMGAVYLAETQGIGARVAIKFLKSEFSDDVEIARRFMNEAKSYARVAHPNAVVFHDFGQDEDGNLFIAMEYCEGVDLKKVIAEQKRLPVADAVDIMLQVADVLGNAHTKGVVHRDLKPENIMLRKGMRGIHAKVLDFGIARLMGEGTRLTVAGAIAGTPRYMSPEQVEGKDVDALADVYALGIVTFEALTGAQPFDGHTIAEILRRQVMDPMPSLKSISADLDYPEIDAVIQKACAKKKSDRWPDMTAFASALAQATPTLAGKPLSGLLSSVPSAATPRPGATTGPGQVTGLETGPDDGTHNTVVRADSLAPQKPDARSGVLNHTINVPDAQQPDASLLIAPKSKAPWVALGVVVVGLLGAGGLFASGRVGGSDVVVPPPPKVVADVKPPPEKVEPEVKMPPPQPNNERDVERGRDYLARGKNAWDRGDLEEAYSYFKDVPVGTDFKTEALGYMAKVDTIREKVKVGQAAQHRGDCDTATNAFDAVLRLNAKISDARSGLAACRQAALPGKLE
ncbi:MAG: protein kinase [Archangiaceae bacterium]|nr:protein kinase [Archangiaceae bacterium]